MTKPKLTYFDAPVSRGEECRLALHLAGVDFEDERLKRDAWLALKPASPFGTLPILTLPGHAPLGQSNAILTLIGTLHGLHPTEPYEAARHLAMMEFVEELRHHVGPTMRVADETQKKAARAQLVATYLPAWGASAEKHIGDGPFLAGAKIHVADLKLYLGVRWFKNGALDHIPATIFDAFPRLTRLHDAVRDHAGVKAWAAKH